MHIIYVSEVFGVVAAASPAAAGYTTSKGSRGWEKDFIPSIYSDVRAGCRYALAHGQEKKKKRNRQKSNTSTPPRTLISRRARCSHYKLRKKIKLFLEAQPELAAAFLLSQALEPARTGIMYP